MNTKHICTKPTRIMYQSKRNIGCQGIQSHISLRPTNTTNEVCEHCLCSGLDNFDLILREVLVTP